MSIPEDILLPPPALKQIIHKTISVLRENSESGEEFLQKLKDSDNISFQFTNEGDLYFPYFEYLNAHPEIVVHVVGNDGNKDNGREEDDEIKSEDIKDVEELQFLGQSDVISSKDLEIVKLAALYVSINGSDGLSELKGKYDPVAFAFLNEDNHSSYRELFLRYLNQYTLLKDQKFTYNLHKSHDELLESCFERAKYQQFEKQQVWQTRMTEEEERMKYLTVDWADFTLVQTIEFTELDEINELDPPVSLMELKYRTLEQKIKQTSAPPVPTTEEAQSTRAINGIKVKEFNARRTRTPATPNIATASPSSSSSSSERQIECPITGRLIPESKFQNHIQILLRDPNYQQIKQNYEAKFKYDNLQSGVDQIVENLKGVVGKKRRLGN